MNQSTTSYKFKLEYTTDSWPVRVLGSRSIYGQPPYSCIYVDKKYDTSRGQLNTLQMPVSVI